MGSGGDEHARAQARRVTALAEQVRAASAELGSAQIMGLDWHSAAAQAFRDRVGQEVVRLRGVAASVDEAAEALALHARALDALDPLVWP
jgi:hypothetical protein